jgi:hypothetical protein
MSGPARESWEGSAHDSIRWPSEAMSEGGSSGVRDGSNSNYAQIPEGYRDQEAGIDAALAVGRARHGDLPHGDPEAH